MDSPSIALKTERQTVMAPTPRTSHGWSHTASTVISVLSFFLSAALSVRLFVSLASDLISAVLLALLALCLEGGKWEAIWAFKNERKLAHAALAAILVVLSLLASTGSALMVVKEWEAQLSMVSNQEQRLVSSYQIDATEISGIDRQIDILMRKLDSIPPEWTMTSRSLRAEIDGLRQTRASAVIRLDQFRLGQNAKPVQADIFGLLAKMLQVDESAFLLGFLLVISGVLEAMILLNVGVTASPEKERRELISTPTEMGRKKKSAIPNGRASEDQAMKPFGAAVGMQSPSESKRRGPGRPRKDLDVEALLPKFVERITSSIDHTGFAQVSRDTAAKELGLSTWQGKLLYRLAIEKGILETRGRRTRSGGAAFSD